MIVRELDSDAKRLLRSENVVELLLVDREKVFAVLVCPTLADELEGLEILDGRESGKLEEFFGNFSE